MALFDRLLNLLRIREKILRILNLLAQFRVLDIMKSMSIPHRFRLTDRAGNLFQDLVELAPPGRTPHADRGSLPLRIVKVNVGRVLLTSRGIGEWS